MARLNLILEPKAVEARWAQTTQDRVVVKKTEIRLLECGNPVTEWLEFTEDQESLFDRWQPAHVGLEILLVPNGHDILDIFLRGKHWYGPLWAHMFSSLQGAAVMACLKADKWEELQDTTEQRPDHWRRPHGIDP